MDTNSEQTNSQQEGSVIDFVLGNDPEKKIEPINNNPAPGNTGQNNPPAAAPAEPAKMEPSTSQANWIEEVAKISNNEINSVEVFNSVLEKSRKFDGLESDHNRLKQEFEALKDQNPFASDYMLKLNEIAKTGDMAKVKLFEKFNTVGDANALEPFNALKLQLQWKHNLTEDQAEHYLKDKYKIDETVHAEDVVAAAKVQMQIDSSSAKEFIKEQQASLEVVPQTNTNAQVETPEQLQQKYEAQVQVLKPVVDGIANKLNGFFSEININGLKDDKANKVELPVSDEVKQKVNDSLLHFAATYGLDPSKDADKMENFARDTAKIFLYDAHIVAASNLREQQLRNEFENPSQINRGNNNPDGGAGNEFASAASQVASGNY